MTISVALIGRTPIIAHRPGAQPYQASVAPIPRRGDARSGASRDGSHAHARRDNSRSERAARPNERDSVSVETPARPQTRRTASVPGPAELGLGVAAGRVLRGAVHGHPRPEHRQRGAALDPVGPRLLLARPAVGGQRLRDHLRRLPAARGPCGRSVRTAPGVRCGPDRVRARLARRRPRAEWWSADRRSRRAGPRRRLHGGVVAGHHHLFVRAGSEAPPCDRHLGGDERPRRGGRRPARRDHHPGAHLALDPADQSPDRRRDRAGGLGGRASIAAVPPTARASTSPAR